MAELVATTAGRLNAVLWSWLGLGLGLGLQLGLVRGVGYPNPSPNQGGRTLILALTREADLDDGGGPTPTPPLTNAPRAPKTHWRQAAQLLPRGVQLCKGGGVRIRAHSAGGRKLTLKKP